MPRLPIAAATIALAALVLGGCSGSTMSQDQAEKQIKTALEKENDVEVEDVSCPGGIDAEAGRTMTCEVTATGETVEVKITITDVDGDTANFDIELVE